MIDGIGPLGVSTMSLDVQIILWGDKLLPIEVTNFLKLSPIRVRNRGVEEARSNNRKRAVQKGMWVYSTRADIASTRLGDHFAHLGKVLDNKIATLIDRGVVEKARICISVDMTDEKMSGTWEDELNGDIIRIISNIGASLYFTVMCPSRS